MFVIAKRAELGRNIFANMAAIMALLFVIAAPAFAAPPTTATVVGDTVTNPATGVDSVVLSLIVDPAGTPTAGTTAFVRTDDGYTILAKPAAAKIYNSELTEFTIVSVSGNAAVLSNPDQDNDSDLMVGQTNANYDTDFDATIPGNIITAPVNVVGTAGAEHYKYGADGGNGRVGVLLVPPTDGKDGKKPGTLTVTLGASEDVTATANPGWRIGSFGGDGGDGGGSYANVWSAADGGDAAAGGTVRATQAPGNIITTTGTRHQGILAFSQSGRPGNGGGSGAAPGGGSGGGSADGGSVTVTQGGQISTTGTLSAGIEVISQSQAGGAGGSQWGLVGVAGSGGAAGDGGAVTVTTQAGATILTTGDFADGIRATSVGGSGGNAGTASNLFVSLNGQGDSGGNGGTVTVSNSGGIRTENNFSRGIMAQSVGGGGGSGGAVGGLFAISLGGAGNGGGSASTVDVTNEAAGVITTLGRGSDGIMAQSIGGSGGGGTTAAGLVAIGGTGTNGGTGSTVTVKNFGKIDTTGDFARGIIAQSIGGGGGDGGSSTGPISVGGKGAVASDGGDVVVLNDGEITTRGTDAMGIISQSIGGGGGNGGSAASVSAFVGVAVGGAGGPGGTGGTANVTLSNTNAAVPSMIQTSGDRSTGIFVQSVGGGGGNGGGAMQATAGAFGAVSVAIGGKAGVAGDGGIVTLAGAGAASVQTGGNDAPAVLLQSVGGGGGNGGYAYSAAASAGPVSGSVSVAIGGNGAMGGTGGLVTVGTFSGSTGIASGFDGSVVTGGERSVGMLFQSVGGGGGNGGVAVSASGAASLTVSASVSVGVGGQGLGGGEGGAVQVFSNSSVTTVGDNSAGLIVQSIGGGGGNGGSSIAATLNFSAGAAAGVAVGVGGDGGDASKGGNVDLVSNGVAIETKGRNSTGALAQSVGGGGGNGGYSVAGGLALASGGAASINVSLGGKGGAGGEGGNVTALIGADVITRNDDSGAVVIQSVGGGGGNGGFSVAAGLAAGSGVAGTVNVGLGGKGDTGGKAGNVTNVNVSGDVTTLGERSIGVVVQSVGGGGGNGGFNVTAGLAGGGAAAGAIGVGLGGEGAKGGEGGTVTATVSGTVRTTKIASAGVVFQSIGGGGGNGGFNVTAGGAGAGIGGGAVTVGLGGKGNGGGEGGQVTGFVTNNVTTSGSDATAILAQSVGGGGGNGGFNVSASASVAGKGSGAVSVGLGGEGGVGAFARKVELTNSGVISTIGDRSAGLVAQSIGGGGGNGGFNVSGTGSGAGVGSGAVSVGLGGNGNGGGDGGEVKLTSTNTITTRGNSATAFLAQSIGGGGGNGGFNVSATISGAGTSSGAIGVGLGGRGMGGGIGVLVTANSSGDIATFGEFSPGLIAQSVGGGGGNGGFNVTPTLSGAGTGAAAVSVGIGGSGGGGGDGGQVDLDVANNVTTEKRFSPGIIAQSIGGGGGNGGFNVSVAGSAAGTGSGAIGVGLGGTGAGGGDADTVDSKVAGNITTKDDYSTGLLVQSVGGGGGNGGMNVSVAVSGANTGSAGVSVGLGGSAGAGGNGAGVGSELTGNVNTKGLGSAGVVVQSLGGGGGNGGLNISAAISAATTGSGGAAIGLGGAGGEGGDAGIVTSEVTGDVMTDGDYAGGVMVQSLGGGGGNGGMNVSAAVSLSGKAGGSVAVGLGGSGGQGGFASAVTGTVTGDVITDGKSAAGVVVQSLGGGGGNGGVNISAALSIAKTGSGAAAIGIGGFGGDGGTSGVVNSTYTGNAMTLQEFSSGVVAQSLGGGGGNGGVNVTAAISVAKDFSGTLGVGVGGFGGNGGASENVTQTVVGNVRTEGDKSIGIMTQSLGGGGGNGGTNVTAALSLSLDGLAPSIGFGVGGFGGGGASAGNLVKSDITGGVTTMGDNSAGVVTQSLGGGGGNGGVNVTAALSVTQNNGGALSLGVGGFGAGAGDGKAVDAKLRSTTDNIGNVSIISTDGDDSTGIVAQSVGGGGGTGGVNVSAAVSLTGKNGAAVALGVGGFGGGGGDAGAVKLDAISNVLTSGNESDGVFVQSLGGGGGNGGTNVSGSLSLTKPSGSNTIFSVAAGVGGFGGIGGDSSTVDLDYTGIVVAQPRDASAALIAAEGANGIVVQSLGGGGGNGGLNVSGGVTIASKPGAGQTNTSSSYGVVLGVGGFGGGGGDADNVDVNIGAGSQVIAHGTGKSGIIAQSVGGGGGNGGVNVSGGIVSDTSLIVGIGGFGGGGGVGKDVTVLADVDIVVTTNPADIGVPDDTTTETKLRELVGDKVVETTEGLADSFGFKRLMIDLGLFSEEKADTDGSAGLLAQSVGGGGGNGGLNVSGGIALNKDGKIPSLTFGIGGFGGAGNIAGNVDAGQTGTVSVEGNWKHGIFAQSIGGGGGNGGLNVSGQLSYAKSGSSGGATDMSIVAGLGGHGGTGADAGDVIVTQTGAITTNGYHARGLFAQSIGGGGGTGGINVSFVATQNSSPIAMGVGGFGSGGGDAGDVTVTRGTALTAAGSISTNGSGSHGIEASSIGGGGGDAGVNAVLGFSRTTGPNSSGGTGDATGRKTPVNSGVNPSVISNYNSVLDELEGKVNPAPSGGGSKSGQTAVVAIGGSAGTAGDGGEIDIDHFGHIQTLQTGSHGVFGQSIGGGGGNAALNIGVIKEFGSPGENKGFGLNIGGGTGNGGIGGNVDVRNTGNITTAGKDSHGIFAQSVGGGGGNAGYDMLTPAGTGGKVAIQIGRTGGTGGSAGDVLASSDGEVRTQGDKSFGLFAQSVGNGGGSSSSSSVSLTGKDKSDDVSGDSIGLSVGLEGGLGGKAGNVVANLRGIVVTGGVGAHGVFAQSVGGGGGTGGVVSSDASTGTSVAIGIGGKGGTGGTGGTVDVTTAATIVTTGNQAMGVAAQSIGGAGGTGGYAKAGQSNSGALLALGSGDNVGTSTTLNIGGNGGTAMHSGRVTVTNTGVIGTLGELSHGIFAQSVGGGGGMGGLVENRVINLRGKVGTNSAMSIGGSGDGGSNSAAVRVTNQNAIATSGARSAAIYAQSVGGGGGDADQVRNIVLGPSADSATTNSVLFGGSAGDGGAGSTVTVDNTTAATIQTEGARGYGIFAQSVGGGGGNGGTTVSIDGRKGGATSTTSRAIQLSLGGKGGMGGMSDLVTVNNDGTIITRGDAAHAILAQSVGGGGGNGGSSFTGAFRLAAGDTVTPTAQLSIGGSGGSGNTAGDVMVTNGGDIQVDGAKAYGILAQSVGGGGGNGGIAAAMDGNDLKNIMTGKSFSSIGMGGFGGSGANAGDVTVNHTGTIIVNGTDSYGIYAQSIGGGGGNGGYSVANPLTSVLDFALKQTLGAAGVGTGDAGEVTVTTDGDIIVNGAGSEALFVQTVNGGGGSVDTFVDFATATTTDASTTLAAAAHASASTVSSTMALGGTNVSGLVGANIDQSHSGQIGTTNVRSAGMILQSVGGGGGTADTMVSVNPGTNVDVTAVLGAINTDNAGGGDISTSRTGNLSTAGDLSVGGMAQTIGGGGGKLTLQNASGGTPDIGQQAKVTLGADPSMNNDGGAIDLMLSGAMMTSGDFASAQVVQSIGAGGGDATLLGFGQTEVVLGAQDGSTGDGGAISMTNVGDVQTTGEQSHGFVLQSIGGGGGLVTTDLAAADVQLTLSADNGGDGGAISFDNAGDILVTGQDAIGVLAQSLGGGGGAVDAQFRGSAGGKGQGGALALTFADNVIATGEGGIAVFAQSAGDTGGSAITLGFAGLAIGGTGDAEMVAAVVVDGTALNSLSFGTDSILVAGNDQIINAGDGVETVTMQGAAAGNIDLGGGANLLTISAGGRLYAHDSVDLGTAGQMVMNGDLALGFEVTNTTPLTASMVASDFGFGDSVSQTTQMTGGLTFGTTANYTADVFFRANGAAGGDSDLVNVTGDASIGGRVLPQLNTLERALPLVLIDAGGSTSDLGTMITDTVVLDYSIGLNGSTGDGSTIDLMITPDFSIPGMTSNQAAVGDYINRVLNGQGAAESGELFALIGNMTDPNLVIETIDRLTAPEYAINNLDVLYGARRFADVFASCEENSPWRKDFYDHRCAWVTGSQLDYSRNATTQSSAIAIDGDNLTAGFRIPVGEDLYMGLAFGHENIGIDSGDYQARGERLNFGASLTKFSGPWEMTAMLNFGRANYDGVKSSTISGTLPDGTPLDFGPSVITQETRYKNMRLGVAYNQLYADQVTYLRSGLDFDATQLDTMASNSAGRSGALLQDTSQTILTFTPSVEFGSQVRYDGDTNFRANMRAAVLFSNTDEVYINTGLAGASALDGGFRNGTKFDSTVGQLSLNAGFYAYDDSSFVNYSLDRTFGKYSDSTHASVTLGIQF